jgi:PAS domain S-box-containing protein
MSRPMSDQPEHHLSLTQQEEPFLATFALVGFGVAHLTLDGKFTMVSQRLCDMFGRPRNELLAKHFQDIVHPEHSAADWVDLRLLTGEVATTTLERRVVRNDSRPMWIKAVMASVRDEVTREPRYVFAAIEDITARKAARQALRQSQDRLRLLVEMAPEAILVMDPSDRRLLLANRSAEQLFGCSRQELTLTGLERFYPQEQPDSQPISSRIDEHNRRALAGEEVVFERVIQNAKGERRYCEVRLAPYVWGPRRLVLATYFDITQRKLAEEALKRQVEFDKLLTGILTRFTTCTPSSLNESIVDALRQLATFVGVDHAHVIVISDDRSSWSVAYEWCGPNVQPQFGHYQNVPFGTAPWSESRILAGQAVRINALNDYPPDAPERRESDKEAGAKCNLVVPIHGAGETIAGTVGLDSHTQSMAWSDEDVARCRMVGDAIASVLERQRTERALRESEERFRVMADSAPVMMWMSGSDKRCTDFNRGWLQFTGRTLEQEVGDGWTAGVHPDDLHGCVQTYFKSFDQRRAFNMEYRLRRHDGFYRWVTDVGVPRFLPGGSFAGYIGCCVDIDDQRMAEVARRELAGRLINAQEGERTRIARELHDDIGQSLAMLGIQLQRASQAASGEPAITRINARELRDRVKEIGNKISRLSHQLHSSELEYLGLTFAVKSLCREFLEKSHLAIECSCSGVPDELDGTIALGCLRVIQEALHNAVKHSHATDVQVELIGTADFVSLTVSDNGVGFDPGSSSAGPGLGLISMRERMHLLGGDFMISSSPGQGTRITARAPATAGKLAIAGAAQNV